MDELQAVCRALSGCGIAPHQQSEVFAILSAVLHLGNIAASCTMPKDGQQSSGGGGPAPLLPTSADPHVSTAAVLLGVEPDRLVQVRLPLSPSLCLLS